MKRLIIATILLIFTLNAYSQRLGFGITGGPSFGLVSGKDFNGTNLVGTEMTSLGHGGFILQYEPRRFFTVFSGVEFVMKGANINSSKNRLGYDGNTNKLRLNYLEVPLFVKLNFDQYSDIRPNIFAGPTLGFLIAGRDNYLLPSYTGEIPKPLVDTETNYRSFDPGFAFGGGLDLDVGEWLIFTTSAQYVHGFRNIVDNESVFVTEETEFKNRNIRLNFGLIYVIPTFTFNRNSKKDTGFKKFSKHVK